MPTTIIAHEEPVRKIFSSDYIFYIPPYQRPYAWTTEQAGELFDDLLEFMRSGPTQIDKAPPYFLGSIVLIKPETSPNADVVDGQQRLTTLTLLLSAIRSNIDQANATDITPLIYEKGSQILGNTEDRFRLTLRDRDKEFFQSFVQREGGFKKLLSYSGASSDSQHNIRENARLFDSKLKLLSEAQRLALTQFILTRCYLVAVATPDLDSAYRIFSVLNTRGLDLTATDILKAQIIGAISEKNRGYYTKKWETIEEDLGRTAFGELFSHIRMVYRKAKPQGTLLIEFRDHVLQDANGERFIDDILEPFGRVYEELSDEAYTSNQRAERVNENLKWLNKLEFNDWIPPALAFSVRHRNHHEQMEWFFRDLERLAYSMLVRRAGINERIDRFSRLTKVIETGDDLLELESSLQISPTEQYEMYQVLSGPIYEGLSARARSLVLLRLDSLMSGGGATYDYETITVEHVLPQNPSEGSEWVRWFPSVEQRQALVHTLGNLALLTRKKNSSASNYEFERKKDAYFTRGGVSPFALTTQILNFQTWSPAIIDARQKDLLTVLEAHWRLANRQMPEANRDNVSLYQEASWRDDVTEAMRRLGTQSSLNTIYRETETIRRAAGRSIPPSFEAIVRRTLEENSSDSESFKGGPDLFVMPLGRGAGIWSLRQAPTSDHALP